MTYETERRAAVDAILKASRLSRAIGANLASGETMAKQDRSPVTVADFGAQAVICLELMNAFPGDPIVAEEDTAQLRTSAGKSLRERIVHHVKAVFPDLREKDVLAAVDAGSHPGGPTGRSWTIDPIDGTKGFLRGDQYAVALALIQDGEVVLGVLACPNLPIDLNHPEGPKGCLFIGVKGQGATMRALDDPKETSLRVSDIDDPRKASFCESVEAAHSSHSDAARIAELLEVTAPPKRIDSQCKYGLIARGDAAIYLRLPTRKDYQEKIWDHAAGWIIVKEAGGEISDVGGHPLDFSRGKTLGNNTGVVVTNGTLHPRVMAAVQQILGSQRRSSA